MRTFSQRQLPTEVEEASLSFREALGEAGAEDGSVRLTWLLGRLGLAPSNSEANRLVKGRAVEIDGEVVAEPRAPLRDGMLVRVGKHRFLRVRDADQG